MDSNTLTPYYRLMITSISPENRNLVAQAVDTLLTKCTTLGTELYLTSDIKLMLYERGIYLQEHEINQALADWEFTSKAIPGSIERLWFVALK